MTSSLDARALSAVAVLLTGGVAALACSSHRPDEIVTADAGGEAGPQGADSPDLPIEGLTDSQTARFNDGDALFNIRYRESDGLGPLYIRTGCGACHAEVSRGPGLVQKMAVVLGDGFTPAPDQSKLAFGLTIVPLLAAGAKTPILAPPGDTSVKVTIRIGPPVVGHGYMDAVADSEIERMEREQAALGGLVRGRINRVSFASEPNSDTTFHGHKKGDANLVGRFGLKARTATIDDFIAGAFLGDIGMTSPMRPQENPNPDGLTDDAKPGLDAPIESINTVSFYVRTLAIPPRVRVTPEGASLFKKMGCATCHAPSLKTRADYPIAQLAGIDAPVFTDFLLHDMGADLADSVPAGTIDGQAGPRDWRTGALMGLRFNKSFMHDGRAKSVEEAILLHDGPGSEASPCIVLFKLLKPMDRSTLVQYVEAL